MRLIRAIPRQRPRNPPQCRTTAQTAVPRSTSCRTQAEGTSADIAPNRTQAHANAHLAERGELAGGDGI